jgi:uncharacterized SAM-binding protein YcdF (DUF218 family)|tara:strand:- start:87 stop:821 length:735 start_codon:yes stop_codon:yes gene_type:complete
MIFLHKILPLFVMPILVFILIILFSTFKGFKKLTYYSLFLFYVVSTPLFSNLIMKQVEGEYEFGKFENQNKADAIVVLSGIMRINEFENDYKIEWGDTDRFFKGIELYNFNKSNIIVFTGGKSPYNKTKKSEGDILKEYAIKFGVKEEDILITKEVLNTSDESYAVTDLIGNKRTIILVTSAFHMSRAKSLFEKQGHIVIPYKVDFKTPPKLSWNFIDFIASSGGLRKTEIALREVLGRLYYRI